MEIIDLRSDTVTRPSSAMRATMAGAAVGDDVFAEDPTVNRLEALAAEMLGKEAAVFVASGTQGNLLASLTHCERGDELIVGQKAHIYKYEAGGAAVLGGIQMQPVGLEADGTLDLGKVAQLIKPDDYHFAQARLLCLENTQGGKALPLSYLRKAADFAHDRRLALHLDGARIFNAAVKSGVSAETIAGHFDSVSFCLSKGLGAPVGSLLCAGLEQVKQARRWRKMLGGGMRQAGILAAAGMHALENNIDRLADDHANAALLAEGLAEIEALHVEPTAAQTNMVFVRGGGSPDALVAFMKQRGILIEGDATLRLVTHMDVNEKDIGCAIAAFKEFFSA